MLRVPKVGDVFRAPSGKIRIARQVHVHDRSSPRGVYITFTIQRCSWTGRAVTCYTLGELRGLGYKLLKKNFALNSKFDKLMAEDAALPDKSQCNFKCCEVRGIL